MLFRESFLTDGGSDIFARLAASEGTLVWTRAATSSKNADDEITFNMNRMEDIVDASSEYTSSGVVTNAVANIERLSVSIFCELTNEEYSGEARLFGAWAKIAGDSEDTLVVVARCGTGVVPTYINPASEGIVKAFVDFTLSISAEQAHAIGVSETNYYATSSALQAEVAARDAAIRDLANRIVTTHAEGDPTAGDNQTILGEKTFSNQVRVNTLSGNTIGCETIETNNIGNGSLPGSIDVNQKLVLYGDIGTASNGLSYIGSSDKRINTISVITVSSMHTKAIDVQVPTMAQPNSYIGTSSVPYANIWAEHLHGDLTGNVTGNLTGLIPAPNQHGVPIGSILFAMIERSSDTDPDDTWLTGDDIYWNSSAASPAYKLHYLNFTGIIPSEGSYLPDGTYRALSNALFNATTTQTVILVMRVG